MGYVAGFFFLSPPPPPSIIFSPNELAAVYSNQADSIDRSVSC